MCLQYIVWVRQMKSCFLFGHADCPENIFPRLEEAIRESCEKYEVTEFYVGSRGRFDGLAAKAVRAVKKQYPEICLYQLLAYHPEERPTALRDHFDGSYYPPLENTPRQYAIVKANRYMVQTVDMVLCYVWHPGNTKALLALAEKRKIPILNLAEEKEL